MANGTDKQFSGVYLGGAILVGVGLFNTFDGTIDHYVLDLHNVVHSTHAWNPHWVVLSVLMLGAGIALLYWSDGAVDSSAA